MWPRYWRQWLDVAEDLAVTYLRGKLDYPNLIPCLPELIPWAIQRTAQWAKRRRRYTGYFGDRTQFLRAFCCQAFSLCLRRLPALEPVAACLPQLPDDQRRLLLWPYKDHRTYAEIAAILDPHKETRETVRPRCKEAYNALRSRIAVRLGGEEFAGFPVFPAGVGQGF